MFASLRNHVPGISASPILVLAFVSWSSSVAQVLGVNIVGTTATQAVLTYAAPDRNPCTVKVSQNPSFVPLVADVDPNIFAGSQLDNRPVDAAGDTLTGSLSRTFVVGQRTSQIATAGPYAGQRHYSRALQTATTYYAQIACGRGASVVGSAIFSTKTIPLGNTYPDPWLTDPDHPGDEPWPESVGGSTPESFIDPLTGVALTRISTRGDGHLGPDQALFSTAYNAGQSPCDTAGPWKDPCGAVGTSGYASVDQSTGWLVLRGPIAPLGYGQYSYQDPYATSLDQLQVGVAGSASGCTGLDCQIDACLSLNGGASCLSSIRSAMLSTTGTSQINFGNQIDTESSPGIDPWILYPDPVWQTKGYSPYPAPRISIQEISARRGTGSIDGNTLTWTGGDIFSLAWVAGGNAQIRLAAPGIDACPAAPSDHVASTEYTIAGFKDGLTLSLSPTPSLGGETVISWCVQPFALMLRRHSAGSGTVYLGAASMTYIESPSPATPSAGAGSAVFSKPVAGGYFSYFGGLQWTNPGTGKSVYYGQPMMPLPMPTNPYKKILCPYGQSAAWDNSQAVPTWYCVAVLPADNGSNDPPKIVVGRGQFGMVSGTMVTAGVPPASAPYGDGYGTYANIPCSSPSDGISACSADGTPGDGAFLWTLLTPFNADITAQMVGFDTRFNANNYSNCFNSDTEDGVFFFYCYSSAGQNTPGWVFAFSPGDGHPEHAGMPGGPSIIGAVNTYATPIGSVANGQTAMTGQGLHSVAGTGEAGWIEIGMDAYAPMTTTQSTVPATSSSCPAGVAGQCIQLQMDSYNGSGYEPHLASSQSPFSDAPGELRTTQIGDTACITGTPGSCTWWLGEAEILTLVAKGPSGLWTFQRKGYGGELEISASTKTMYWQSIPFATPPGAKAANPFLNTFWNPSSGCPGGGPDPHGDCLMQTTNASSGHGFWSANGSAVDVNLNWSPTNYAAAYETIVGNMPSIFNQPFADVTPGQEPTVTYTSAGPPFHGAGVDSSFNDLQSHPAAQGVNAGNPRGYVSAFDVRPFLANETAASFTPVAGQLYVSNPQFVRDADDFAPFGSTAEINRKLVPTAASCGSHPLLDISGPGAILSGIPADSYRYAIVRTAGEVQPNSSVGQIYVNCPGVIPLATVPATMAGCAGNGVSGGSVFGAGNDICVSNMSSVAQRVVQFRLGKDDQYGRFTRTLVSAIGRLRMTGGFANVRPLPDNSGILFRSDWLNYNGNSVWMATVPPLPLPLRDGVNRGRLVPVQMFLSPPPNMKIAAAAIQFGYAEYDMNCTTRNDPCVATKHTATISAAPFAFASENPKPKACTPLSGCLITIPAAPGHILFTRISYWDKKGTLLRVDSFEAQAVP